MSDGGKGDKARPLSIPKEKFNAQWDSIFKKTQTELQDAQAEDEAFRTIENQMTLRVKDETGK